MRQTESRLRAGRTAMIIAAVMLGLSGCSLHHRKAQPFVLPPFTPVALAQVSAPEDPPLIEGDDDEDDLPPVPVAEEATVPKRHPRRTVKTIVPTPVTDVPPPVQVAATDGAAEAASVIGQLTPGGDQDPRAQHEASELIASNEKRLNALPADTLRREASLVSNVKNFQKQAQQALNTGDAAGAKTLATKGKLLLDDLEKTSGS